MILFYRRRETMKLKIYYRNNNNKIDKEIKFEDIKIEVIDTDAIGLDLSYKNNKTILAILREVLKKDIIAFSRL
jgi:hypothetical protein